MICNLTAEETMFWDKWAQLLPLYITIVKDTDSIDGTLLAWIDEAYSFAESKR